MALARALGLGNYAATDMEPLPLPPQTTWAPLAPSAIQDELGDFTSWVLCGGHSVALLTGRDTRCHGDTDIGVFRSDLPGCLRALGQGRIHLCRNGALEAWHGQEIPPEVHDLWITCRDDRCWILQIMVFDDDGDRVSYRRDPRIHWSKHHHSVVAGGIRVLNPFITFLFKANQAALAEKDAHDLRALIASIDQHHPVT